MHDQFDRGSKWLLQHHGDAILRLGGITGVNSWKSVAAELVQPKQLPDGLLEVSLDSNPGEPTPFVIEIATYPEERLLEQVTRDAMLVYLERRVVPDILTLILRPKGNVRIGGSRVLASADRTTRIEVHWRVVELWNLSAEQLLAANDVGLVPWVPLTQFSGPPEKMLSECRRRIDEQAPMEEQENLLVVTQVLAGLRYNSVELLKSLGGDSL